jgi:hypothetical protein
MVVFFNEICLSDEPDIDNIVLFLNDNIRRLHNSRIKIFTRVQEIYNWYSYWETDFDLTLKNYIPQILLLFEECQENTEQFYYYHFRHQDFDLTISDNISTSSIAKAADIILLKQITAILNIPESKYCERPFLPILKSSYDSNNKDELALIPCFIDAKSVIRFAFLHEKIKPLLTNLGNHEEFEEFYKEYQTFINRFNFDIWEPKVFLKDTMLSPENSFPAITCEYIKSKLSYWRVKKEEYLINSSDYKVVGGIVLELHGYTKNNHLSSHYSYEIYEAGYGRSKLLISIDTENGSFEVIDFSGTHIGVYGYDGTYIKHYADQTDINSHSLRNLPTHMFIFK